MKHPPIPSAMAGVTAAWLTAALREGGALPAGQVSSVRCEEIGADSGMSGVVARVALTYAEADTAAPQSLIVKLASPSADRRAFISGMYERELRFYRELAPHVDLRTPRTYYGDFDTASHLTVLLLEDMAPTVPGDNDAGCSFEQAQLALRAIARLHASWWGDRRLLAMDWLTKTEEPNANRTETLRQRYPAFEARFGAHVPAVLRPLLPHLLDPSPIAIDAPPTLIHGDFSGNNVCFGDGVATPALTIFDWQLAGCGAAAEDAGGFLLASIANAVVGEWWGPLLCAYHAALVEAGVTSYSLDQLLVAAQRVVFRRMRRAINIGGGPAADEYRLSTARRNLERAGIILADVDPAVLLA